MRRNKDPIIISFKKYLQQPGSYKFQSKKTNDCIRFQYRCLVCKKACADTSDNIPGIEWLRCTLWFYLPYTGIGEINKQLKI